MSDYAFNYSFNITGNASTAAQQITGDVTALNNTVKQATGIWDSFAGKVVAFNQLSQFVEGFSRTVDETLAPGAALNASLADLSAISGETGESLKTIERYARDAAKTFGGSAAQSVESYKLLLSQLSPELAKTPDALKAMGDNIAVLSKTMGGDAKAAAEVLTTAMNQYGVSLADPMEASRKMAQMMNVMAAAGRGGFRRAADDQSRARAMRYGCKGGGRIVRGDECRDTGTRQSGQKGSRGRCRPAKRHVDTRHRALSAERRAGGAHGGGCGYKRTHGQVENPHGAVAAPQNRARRYGFVYETVRA
jgi:hypothetical protein